ncbi:MAG: 23S rRNA (adenine(1618)-N(6))-methyltransferase RlmF [Bacteroidales bacterium]|nr:23S rRNA (adenine(1618)-N(6))-methyltransferase RlmF [Bacteroidales bacterium]
MQKKLSNKEKLHPRNKHKGSYDFKQLTESCPELAQFVSLNVYKNESIDFSNPKAVKTLNKALLKHFYNIENWDIPDDFLTPPIPGRADYIHFAADLLSSKNNNIIPKGKMIKGIDIGVGANCIYPIIGTKEYGWSFVGTDISQDAIDNAKKIIESNTSLKNKIELRLQPSADNIFKGIFRENELFDLTICNPPFHSSAEEAKSASLRKLNNLKIEKKVLNFGGQNTELWCEGGEKPFIKKMISESKLYANSCFWFTSLVSKESNLKSIYKELEKVNVQEIKTIPMNLGNKTRRIIAWTFLTLEQQKKWIKIKWR